MARSLRSVFSQPQRKTPAATLALIWSLSVGVGIVCGIRSDLSLLYPCLDGAMSWTGTLCISVLPFLLSVIAVFFHIFGLLYAVCAVKAFLLGFISMGCIASGTSFVWIVRWFLMFSDLMAAPVLYLYWLRRLEGNTRESALGYAGILVLISVTDYTFIAPTLQGYLHSMERITGIR